MGVPLEEDAAVVDEAEAEVAEVEAAAVEGSNVGGTRSGALSVCDKRLLRYSLQVLLFFLQELEGGRGR